jgi:hypothetical protein
MTRDPSSASLQLPPLPALPKAPTRRQVIITRAALAALSLLFLATAVTALGLRRDRHELSWLFSYGQPLLWVGFALLMLRFATSSKWSSQPWKVRFAAVIAPLALFASTLWLESGPSSLDAAHRGSALAGTLLCGASTLLFGAAPVVAAVLALRRAFATDAVWRGAVVGACCGLAGAAAMHLHCAVASRSHMLLAHALPAVVLAALGAWAASRWLRA